LCRPLPFPQAAGDIIKPEVCVSGPGSPFRQPGGDRAIDIRNLLEETGHTTLDSGYMNTGSCTPAITCLDGAKGVLDYRGYAIEALAKHCSFTEVAYLILHGELPTFDALEFFKHEMRRFALLHEDMIHFFDHFPPNASPMSLLFTTVNALHNYYPGDRRR
jgi:citrate synthase